VTEFKVGDRVRFVAKPEDGYPANYETTIYWDGGTLSVRDADGEDRFFFSNDWTLVYSAEPDPRDTELAKLRAFRDTALAAGYVPPVPVDPDVAEAQKIAEADGWGYGDFTPNDGSAVASIYAAIKRGRQLAAQEAGK